MTSGPAVSSQPYKHQHALTTATAKIDDEESQQIEGLHVEDARPWAKQVTKGLLERGFVGYAHS